MKGLTIREVHQDLTKKHGSERASRMVLDIVTGGAWVAWDDEKINQLLECYKIKRGVK
jgi:hypothetical protein